MFIFAVSRHNVLQIKLCGMFLTKVIEKKDPRTPDSQGKYYGKMVKVGTVTTDDIATIIAERSGHSVGQVKGFFRDYFRALREYLIAGKRVEIQPIGTLYVTFRGLGSETPEDYETSLISGFYIHLRKSSRLGAAFSLFMNPKMKFKRYENL